MLIDAVAQADPVPERSILTENNRILKFNNFQTLSGSTANIL